MDLCFVDSETTSLSAEHGEIWEWAGIRRNAEGQETRLLFQISDVDLGKADPFSLKIGNYYERYGKHGEWSVYLNNGDPNPNLPTRGELVDKMDAAMLISDFTADTTMIGNVISFDSERMERLLRANWQCPRWHYHVIDIEPMIVGYLKGKNPEFQVELPYKSDDLSAAIGVELPTDEERHTAMGDAEWVKRQWDALHGS